MKVSDLTTSNPIQSRLISLQNDLSRSKMQQKRYQLQLRNLVSTRAKISQSVQELSANYQKEVKQMQQRIKKLEQQNRKLVKSNSLYKMSIENFEKTILEKDKIISTILGKQLIASNRVQQQQQQQKTLADRSQYDGTIVGSEQVVTNKSNRSIQRSNGRIKAYPQQSEVVQVRQSEEQEIKKEVVATQKEVREEFNPIIASQQLWHQHIVIEDELLTTQQGKEQITDLQQIHQQQQQQQQLQQQSPQFRQQQPFQTLQQQTYMEDIHIDNNNDFTESIVFNNNSPQIQFDLINPVFKPFEGLQSQKNGEEKEEKEIINYEKHLEEERKKQEPHAKQLHSEPNKVVEEPITEHIQIKKIIPPPPKGKRVGPPPPAKKSLPPQQQWKPQPVIQVKDTQVIQETVKITAFKKPPPPPAGGIKPKAIRQKHIQRYKPVQFQDQQFHPQPQEKISPNHQEPYNENIQWGQSDIVETNKEAKSRQQIVQSANFTNQNDQFPIQSTPQQQQQRISFDDNITQNYYPTQAQDENKVEIQNMSHGSINRSKRGKRHHAKHQPYNIINFDDNQSTQQPTYDMFGSLNQDERTKQQSNYGLMSKTQFPPKKQSQKTPSQVVQNQYYQFNFRPQNIQQDHEMHGIVDESSIQQIDDLSMISGSIFPQQHQHFESDRFLNSEKKRKGSQHEKREEKSQIVEVVLNKKMSKKRGKRDNVQTISPITFV